MENCGFISAGGSPFVSPAGRDAGPGFANEAEFPAIADRQKTLPALSNNSLLADKQSLFVADNFPAPRRADIAQSLSFGPFWRSRPQSEGPALEVWADARSLVRIAG